MSHQSNDSTGLQLFNFEGQDVRTLEIDGSILFVNADVSVVLDIDPTQARRLDDDEKGLYTIQTLGGPQQMLCVTESGLYHLIFTSRKDEAKAFRRWVTGEVLPSIRKTGTYSVLSSQLGTIQKVEKIFRLLLEAVSTKEILENKQLAPSGLFMLRKMRLMFYRAVRDYEGVIKIYHSKKYKPGFKSSAEPLAIITQNGDLVVKLQFPFIEE